MSDEAKEEEEEALLEKINFPLLCRDFKRYHSEFYTALQRTPFANPEYGAVCLTTFGLTGVGKSTLLARLVSNLPPDDFFEAIQDRSSGKEHVTIGGITIGHRRTSTTVVPKIFSVGPIHACDMPGFCQADPGIRICIDVLQKCFLTGVRNIRLLIVVDIAAIDELRVQTLRNGYHEALRTLLGPDYDESINLFYFVFTKNEELGYDNEAINKKMMKIVYDLSEGNDPAALKFFRRMAMCHVVVDLRTDDQAGLLRKLQELIEADETDKKRLSKVATWDVKSLKAGENRINKLCLFFVERVMKKQRLIKQDSDALRSQTKSTKKDIGEQSQALSKEIAEKVDALKQAEEKLKKTKDAIQQYPSQRSDILSSLDNSKHLLEEQKRMEENKAKIKRLASELKDLESSHEVNVDQEVGLRDNVGRARLALKIVVDKTKKQGQIFFNKCENLKDMIRQLQKRIAILLDDALTQNIREIDEIFRKNNLENELSGHLEVLNDEFGPLERGSIELFDAVSRFQIENDGLMKKVLRGAEPLLLVPT